MADAKSMERIVLKVLSGVQAGAEVSLPPGEYTLGSGAEDDIQFVDVSLKPKHARLRLGAGKIEIIGTSGTLTTANGLSLAADADDWQEIEPLDVITAGTMRFALGLPSANWTSLGDAVAPEGGADHPRARRRPGGPQQAAKRMPAGRLRQYALPVVLLALVGGSAAYLLSSSGDRTQTSVAAKLTDLQLARQAFDAFVFGRTIQLKQEVDGTIYASGYVESPVERRALMGAVEKAGLQVRFRVSVLQSMRSEVDNLIKASKLPLTFQLTENGTLVLEGLILKEEVMQKFVDRLTTDVTGIAQFENHVRTAKSLLAEIEKLGRMAQIDQYVVLRLDNDLIEINGILPADKTDAWVGFLQSYSRRFGKDIALRSFVQLQNANGTLTQADLKDLRPIFIGPTPAGSHDLQLDIDRLKQGLYGLTDVFVGLDKRTPIPGTEPPGSTPLALRDPAGINAPTPALPAAKVVITDSIPRNKTSQLETRREHDEVADLVTRANQMIDGWLTGQPNDLQAAMDKVAQTRASLDPTRKGPEQLSRAEIAARYLPVFTGDIKRADNDPDRCWTGSRLTVKNLPIALFWLDIFSVSTALSLDTMSRDEQSFVLEAALNPHAVAQCLQRVKSPSEAAQHSVYLAEAARNPDFVRYVTRNLKSMPLDVSGANLAGTRFLQTRDGAKMPEGAAADGESRVAMVGELGVALQTDKAYSIVIYGGALNWMLSAR